MDKKIAIIQSNYIPWLGYFDIISHVDEFVFLDSVQYTSRDWRNRNKIKTKQGSKWLTIPVIQKSREQTISETKVVDSKWVSRHLNLINQNYKTSTYFEEVMPELEALYFKALDFELLSDINFHFISQLIKLVGIDTKITRDDKYLRNTKFCKASDRLAHICNKARGNIYLSGPSAKSYLELDTFEKYGINVRWMDYPTYPVYKQAWEGFDSNLSILDILLCSGKQSVLKALKCNKGQ